jgi:hypothetical protein
MWLRPSDRSRVIFMMAVSLLILVFAVVVRVSTPSPFAPRVRVRWTPAAEEARRAALERQLHLRNGSRADDGAWEYDLVDPSPVSVAGLVGHADVADTHYIDRSTATVVADAPSGTLRVPERRMAALVHSLLFDWFLLFWASATLVSGVWLASGADARD